MALRFFKNKAFSFDYRTVYFALGTIKKRLKSIYIYFLEPKLEITTKPKASCAYRLCQVHNLLHPFLLEFGSLRKTEKATGDSCLCSIYRPVAPLLHYEDACNNNRATIFVFRFVFLCRRPVNKIEISIRYKAGVRWKHFGMGKIA